MAALRLNLNYNNGKISLTFLDEKAENTSILLLIKELKSITMVITHLLFELTKSLLILGYLEIDFWPICIFFGNIILARNK